MSDLSSIDSMLKAARDTTTAPRENSLALVLVRAKDERDRIFAARRGALDIADADDKKSFAEMQQNMAQAEQELGMVSKKMMIREQVRDLCETCVRRV